MQEEREKKGRRAIEKEGDGRVDRQAFSGQRLVCPCTFLLLHSKRPMGGKCHVLQPTCFNATRNGWKIQWFLKKGEKSSLGSALHTNGRGRTSKIIQHLEMSERQHGSDNRQQEGWQTYSWSCGSGNTQGHSHHGNFVWKGNNFVSSLPWGRAGWIIKNTRKLFFFGALHQGPKIAESEDTKSKA